MTQRIIPYLTVKGAADAIAFYTKAFGAVETKRQTADDGKRLMHASIVINGGAVMLADEFSERGGTPAPTPGKPTSVAVAITLRFGGRRRRNLRSRAGGRGAGAPVAHRHVLGRPLRCRRGPVRASLDAVRPVRPERGGDLTARAHIRVA